MPFKAQFCIFYSPSFWLELFSVFVLCPYKHTPISWPAEPRKEVWTGEMGRVTQRDG